MNIVQGTITVRTSDSLQVVSVYDKIQSWLRQIGAEDGIITLFSRHTTAGVTINEAESGLLKDIASRLGELVPPEAGYQHDRVDRNAHSHIMVTIVGSSVCIPVEEGGLALGTWQKPLLVECDGPRNRTLSMTFLGTSRNDG